MGHYIKQEKLNLLAYFASYKTKQCQVLSNRQHARYISVLIGKLILQCSTWCILIRFNLLYIHGTTSPRTS